MVFEHNNLAKNTDMENKHDFQNGRDDSSPVDDVNSSEDTL